MSARGYHRKIIRITAEDSPNVRLALAQIAAGKQPTGEILIPGVIDWHLYQTRRKHWDPQRQTIGLDAQFYRGRDVMMFPEDQLKRSLAIARNLLANPPRRRPKSMGVDAAEGGDSTVWTIVDELGIIFQLSMKTADTSDIPGQTLGLMKDHRLLPEDVFFDRGGGGRQHADQLRRRGYDVRTVGFGEGAGSDNRERRTSTVKPPVGQRVETRELRYAYKNRRAEMYALTSELICGEQGFAIPVRYYETIQQLKIIPKYYDNEGRLYLPPKDKPTPTYQGVTIKGILGRSPDEADSLVLAVYGMVRRPKKVTAGAL